MLSLISTKRGPSPILAIACAALVSCGSSVAPLMAFPRRPTPAGYPVIVAEDGSAATNTLPLLGDDALARPLVGRTYACLLYTSRCV